MKKITLFLSVLAFTLTQAQVSLVRDINPGAGNGIGDEIISLNNRVIFAGDDGTNGFSLWTSDGTLSNTSEFLFINNSSLEDPKNFYSYSSQNIIAMSGEGLSQGQEGWLMDNNFDLISTSDYNISGGSEPSDMGQFSGFLIFPATEPTIGRELVYTFPFGSVTLVEDINPGPNSSNPTDFITLGNAYYFSADNGSNGRELWSSFSVFQDAPNLFLDINPGATSSNPSNFIVFNNKLYFIADDGINGRELWVTDGTVPGTQMVFDLYAGAIGSNPENLTVFNNLLCFTATHPTLGTELFKMTTLESVFNVKNIAAGSNSSNPSSLNVFNGVLYFSADDGVNGTELWSSTGFSSTTNMLKNINTSPSSPDSNPKGFTEYNSKLYFSANDGTNGIELWVTDGTNAGTVMIDDINTSGDSNPSDLIVANNLLFFSSDDGSTGIELFKYYDPTLSINNVELDNSILLFPNPTNDSFSIETKHIINHISINNIQGKSVKSFKESLTSYNIEELTSGLYFINIKTNEGQITKKLIKQ